MKRILMVEKVHLLTGCILILSGILSYQKDGVGSMLGWAIFGAMYISMSDIGEAKMSDDERASVNHKIRTCAAYLGAGLSVWFLVTVW